MRYARLTIKAEPAYARLEGARAHLLDRAPWLGGTPTGVIVDWAADMLLAPVDPRKVLCVGRNYAAHAKELGNEVPKEPLLFLKPSSSVIGPGASLELPPESKRVEHEAELGVVVGRRCKRVSPQDAMAHVFGFAAVCDVTARDLQKSDGQWSRAKGFDGFCPVGPWVETDLDPRDVRVVCRVNGAVRQDGRTSAMVFDVAHLVSYMSHAMTLEPGDLLVTGTPEGVGGLHEGDLLEVEIEGIGVLAVRVKAPS
jgi:2-keto-4-pentenoate hydratase/2-oxohepta-3-ene-1,7-dioic acid hydratase in catechol pathway